MLENDATRKTDANNNSNASINLMCSPNHHFKKRPTLLLLCIYLIAITLTLMLYIFPAPTHNIECRIYFFQN